jgi:hypothetical protein
VEVDIFEASLARKKREAMNLTGGWEESKVEIFVDLPVFFDKIY